MEFTGAETTARATCPNIAARKWPTCYSGAKKGAKGLNRIACFRLPVAVGLLLALTFVIAACGGSGASESAGVSGNISIQGSSTVQPITQAAAELFREQNPEARIEVGGAGTSDGFEAFCKGETQISDASRPIDVAEEVPVCKENGVEFIEIPIAYDGISVVVNEQNDWATDVTSEELKTMWSRRQRARSPDGTRCAPAGPTGRWTSTALVPSRARTSSSTGPSSATKRKSTAGL